MQNVTLTDANGKEWHVPETRAWGLIEAVEDVVSLQSLATRLNRDDLPAARVYRAYCAALTYAGAKGLTPNELREATDYRRCAVMAYELCGILALAQPGEGLNLDTGINEEASAEEAEAGK